MVAQSLELVGRAAAGRTQVGGERSAERLAEWGEELGGVRRPGLVSSEWRRRRGGGGRAGGGERRHRHRPHTAPPRGGLQAPGLPVKLLLQPLHGEGVD